MSQSFTQSKLTFEQYLDLPCDGQRIELVNGDLVKLDPPRQRHHRIQRSLDRLLSTYAKQHGLDWEPSVTGQGVQVSGKDSYIPDLVVATTAQWEDLEAINESSIFRLGNPPLLVVEVVSPDSQKKDAEERLIGYATARVPEYWIVNPFIATVSVWILEAQVYTCKGKFKGDQQVKSELLKHLTMASAYLLGDM